jgi:hypothetical protein
LILLVPRRGLSKAYCAKGLALFGTAKALTICQWVTQAAVPKHAPQLTSLKRLAPVLGALWSLLPVRLNDLCVGGDFALVNDQATKFVAKHWLAISSLAHGAEAA